MTFDELTTRLRATGWIADDRWDSLLQSSGSNPDALLALLRERQLLNPDQWTTLTSWWDPSAAIVLSEEPTPLSAVPPGHDDLPFVPDDLTQDSNSNSFTTSSPKRVAEKPMSRETMWTWIGVGGGLWAIGLLILALWMGGCLGDTAKPKPRPKVNDGKQKL